MHHNTNAHVNANMEQILKQETETAPVAKRKKEKLWEPPRAKKQQRSGKS